jgi:autotransporter-associated beta strand protein
MFSRNTMSLLGLLIAAMLGLALVAPAQAIEYSYSWLGDNDTNLWSTVGNWNPLDGGTPPLVTGDTARFGTAGGLNLTVYINAPAAATTIIFENTDAGYILTGTSALTLSAGTTPALIQQAALAKDSTISAGLTLGGDLEVNVAGGDAGANNLTIGGQVTGGTSLTKTGAGTLTLSGDNSLTFTGGVVIDSGTLAISSGTNLGDGSVTNTLTIKGKLQVTGTAGVDTGTRNVTLAGTGTPTIEVVEASQVLTVGKVEGVALTKTGAGKLVLQNAVVDNNTFAGLNINAGTVSLGASDQIVNTANVDIDATGATGSTLDIADKTETVAKVTLRGDAQIVGTTGTLTAGEFDVRSGTVSAKLGGAATLTKTTGGTVTLSGANTYTGLTTVSEGTLKLQGVAFSETARNYSITSGAVLNIDGNTGFATGVTDISGGGTLRVTGGTWGNEDPNNPRSDGRDITMSLGSGALIDVQLGAKMINGGWQAITWDANKASLKVDGTFDIWDGNGVRVDALTGAGTITTNSGGRTLNIGVDGGTGNFTGIIENGITLTKEGAGVQTLSGPNTYTGETRVIGGTLATGASNVLPDGTTLTIDGAAAVLDIGGNTDTVGAVNLKTGGTINGAGTLTGSSYAVESGAINAALAGAGTLTKNTAGTVTLSGANVYTGNTNVDGGTLKAGVASVTGVSGAFGLNSAVILQNNAGVTLDITGYDTQIGSLAGGGTTGGNVILGAATLTVGTNNAGTTFSGAIGSPGDTGRLVKVGTGQLTLSGANQYAGGTTLRGGITQIGDDTQLGAPSGTLTFDGGTLQNNNTEPVLNASRTVQLDAGGGGLRSGWGKTITVNGKVTGTGSLNIVWDGAAIILTNPANDYAGNTIIGSDFNGTYWDNSGAFARLRLGVANAIPYGATAGNVVFGDRYKAYLDLNGKSAQINGLTGGSNATIDNEAGGGKPVLTVGDNNQTSTFGGVIKNSTGILSLTKIGDGTLTLSGANTYTGTTTVNAGVLQAGSATAFGTASTASLAFGAGSTGKVQLNGNSMTVIGLQTNATVGTPIVENGTAGTVTLTVNSIAASTYAGVLQNGADGILALTKAGAGTQVLSGTNTYTGTTAVNAGTLQAAKLAALPNQTTLGFATVANGATLGLGVGGAGEFAEADITTVLTNATFASAASLGLDTTGGDFTYGPAITNTLALTKFGANKLTLSGANTYGGATNIVAGTIQLNSGANLATAALNGAGTLDNIHTDPITITLGGSNASGAFSGTIQDTGGAISLTKVGTGTQTFSGTSTYSGGTTVSDGTLRITKGASLGDSSSAIALGNGTKLQFTGGLNTVNQAINLAPGDSATIDVVSGYMNWPGQYSAALNGVVSGGSTSTLNKTGFGELIVNNNANTFAGIVNINDGVLVLAKMNALASASTVNVNRFARLDVQSFEGLYYLNSPDLHNVVVNGGGTLRLFGDIGYPRNTTVSPEANIMGTVEVGGGVANYNTNQAMPNLNIDYSNFGPALKMGQGSTFSYINRNEGRLYGSELQLVGDTYIFNSSSRDLHLAEATGAGALIKTGYSQLLLRGKETFTGPLVVDGAGMGDGGNDHTVRLGNLGSLATQNILVTSNGPGSARGNRLQINNDSDKIIDRISDTATINFVGGYLEDYSNRGSASLERLGTVNAYADTFLKATREGTASAAQANTAALLYIDTLNKKTGGRVEFQADNALETDMTNRGVGRIFISKIGSTPIADVVTANSGLIGGWATMGQDWATYSTTPNIGVAAYSAAGLTYNAAAAYTGNMSTQNMRPGVTANANVAADATINSLLLQSNSNITYTAGTTLTIATGGILKTNLSTPADSAIGTAGATDQYLTAGRTVGTDADLTITNRAGKRLNVNAIIKDNGAGKVTVSAQSDQSTDGQEIAFTNNQNSYSGGTWINRGKVLAQSSTGTGKVLGTGPITFAGGELRVRDDNSTTWGNDIIVLNDGGINVGRATGSGNNKLITFGNLVINAGNNEAMMPLAFDSRNSLPGRQFTIWNGAGSYGLAFASTTLNGKIYMSNDTGNNSAAYHSLGGLTLAGPGIIDTNGNAVTNVGAISANVPAWMDTTYAYMLSKWGSGTMNLTVAAAAGSMTKNIVIREGLVNVGVAGALGTGTTTVGDNLSVNAGAIYGAQLNFAADTAAGAKVIVNPWRALSGNLTGATYGSSGLQVAPGAIFVSGVTNAPTKAQVGTTMYIGATSDSDALSVGDSGGPNDIYTGVAFGRWSTGNTHTGTIASAVGQDINILQTGRDKTFRPASAGGYVFNPASGVVNFYGNSNTTIQYNGTTSAFGPNVTTVNMYTDVNTGAEKWLNFDGTGTLPAGMTANAYGPTRASVRNNADAVQGTVNIMAGASLYVDNQKATTGTFNITKDGALFLTRPAANDFSRLEGGATYNAEVGSFLQVDYTPDTLNVDQYLVLKSLMPKMDMIVNVNHIGALGAPGADPVARAANATGIVVGDGRRLTTPGNSDITFLYTAATPTTEGDAVNAITAAVGASKIILSASVNRSFNISAGIDLTSDGNGANANTKLQIGDSNDFLTTLNTNTVPRLQIAQNGQVNLLGTAAVVTSAVGSGGVSTNGIVIKGGTLRTAGRTQLGTALLNTALPIEMNGTWSRLLLQGSTAANITMDLDSPINITGGIATIHTNRNHNAGTDYSNLNGPITISNGAFLQWREDSSDMRLYNTLTLKGNGGILGNNPGETMANSGILADKTDNNYVFTYGDLNDTVSYGTFSPMTDWTWGQTLSLSDSSFTIRGASGYKGGTVVNSGTLNGNVVDAFGTGTTMTVNTGTVNMKQVVGSTFNMGTNSPSVYTANGKNYQAGTVNIGENTPDNTVTSVNIAAGSSFLADGGRINIRGRTTGNTINAITIAAGVTFEARNGGRIDIGEGTDNDRHRISGIANAVIVSDGAHSLVVNRDRTGTDIVWTNANSPMVTLDHGGGYSINPNKWSYMSNPTGDLAGAIDNPTTGRIQHPTDGTPWVIATTSDLLRINTVSTGFETFSDTTGMILRSYGGSLQYRTSAIKVGSKKENRTVAVEPRGGTIRFDWDATTVVTFDAGYEVRGWGRFGEEDRNQFIIPTGGMTFYGDDSEKANIPASFGLQTPSYGRLDVQGTIVGETVTSYAKFRLGDGDGLRLQLNNSTPTVPYVVKPGAVTIDTQTIYPPGNSYTTNYAKFGTNTGMLIANRDAFVLPAGQTNVLQLRIDGSSSTLITDMAGNAGGPNDNLLHGGSVPWIGSATTNVAPVYNPVFIYSGTLITTSPTWTVNQNEYIFAEQGTFLAPYTNPGTGVVQVTNLNANGLFYMGNDTNREGRIGAKVAAGSAGVVRLRGNAFTSFLAGGDLSGMEIALSDTGAATLRAGSPTENPTLPAGFDNTLILGTNISGTRWGSSATLALGMYNNATMRIQTTDVATPTITGANLLTVNRGAGKTTASTMVMAGGNLEIVSATNPLAASTLTVSGTLSGYGRVGRSADIGVGRPGDIITTQTGGKLQTVPAKTLEVRGAAINLAAGTLSFAGGTMFLNGPVNPTGPLTNDQAGGTLVLAGPQTYNTGTAISAAAATVRVKAGSSLGAGGITFSGGSATGPVPGTMLAGRLAGSWNTGSANPADRIVYDGLDEQVNFTDTSGASTLINYPASGGRLWNNDTTWVYSATLTITAGNAGIYSFATHFDDNGRLFIGGTQVVAAGERNQGQIDLAVGTYSFEMRYGQGGGGVGPNNGDNAEFRTKRISLGYYKGATTDYTLYTQMPSSMLSTLMPGWTSVIYEDNANGVLGGPAGWETEQHDRWATNLGATANWAAFGGVVNDATGVNPAIVNRINDDFNASVVPGLTVGLRADRVLGGGGAVGTVNFSKVTLGAGTNLHLLGDANILLGGSSFDPMTGGVTINGTGVATIINNSTTSRIRNTSGTGDLLLTGSKQLQFGGKLANNKIILDAGLSAIMDDPGTTVGDMTGGIEVGTGSTLTVTSAVTGSTTYRLNGANSTIRVREGAALGGISFAGGLAPTILSPPLRYGRLAGDFDTTTPNTGTRYVANGLDEQTISYGETDSPPIHYPNPNDILWPAHTTSVYTGTLNITDAGTYWFAENFDDSVLLNIDINGDGVFGTGETGLLSNGGWDTPTASVGVVLDAGPHSFEIRYGQGAGGVGPVDSGTAQYNTRNISLGYSFGALPADYSFYNQIPASMFNPVTNWTTVVYEANAAGSAGWTTELDGLWSAALATGAVFGGVVNETAPGNLPIVNKISDDFSIPATMGVGLLAERGLAVAGGTPGFVEFSKVTLGANSTLYLLSKDNAGILVDLTVADTGATVTPIDSGNSRHFIGDVKKVPANPIRTLTIGGFAPATLVGALDGVNLDVTSLGGITLGSLTIAGSTREAALGGRTISIKGGVGTVLVDPGAGKLEAAAPRVATTSTSGLNILVGQDGSASLSSDTAIQIGNGNFLRGNIVQVTSPALPAVQGIGAMVSVVADDSVVPNHVDAVLASRKSALVTVPPQGTVIGTVQFKNVELGDTTRTMLDTAGGQNLLLGGSTADPLSGSVKIAAGDTATIANDTSDTLTRIRNISHGDLDIIGGDLVLVGAKIFRLGGTLDVNKITIGEGYTPAVPPETIDVSVKSKLYVEDPAVATTFTGTMLVKPNSELNIRAAVGGTYIVEGDTALNHTDATLFIQADANLTIGAGTGGRILVDKPYFSGTLKMDTGDETATTIGLASGDATVVNPINGDSKTLTFRDAQTAAMSSYILTLAGGITEKPATETEPGVSRNVLINRNMVLGGDSEHESTYTGGTMITTTLAANTSGNNSFTVSVTDHSGLGKSGSAVEAEVKGVSSEKTATLVLNAYGFDITDGVTYSNVRVSEFGTVRLARSTPVNMILNGGTIAATADVTAGGVLTDLPGANMTFDVTAGKTLTFAHTDTKAGSGTMTLADYRTWTINNGTVQFNDTFTIPDDYYLITAGNGTLRLENLAADKNSDIQTKASTTYSAGGMVIIGALSATPKAGWVTLGAKSVYSVEQLNHRYFEVPMATAEGIIGLGADVEVLLDPVVYDFTSGVNPYLSTLSLGSTKGGLGVSYKGTLIPDTGTIQYEGDVTSADMPGYSLGGGRGRLNIDVALADVGPIPTPMTNLIIRGADVETAKVAAGSVWLRMANTITGEVQVQGNLVFGDVDALADVSVIRVFPGSTIDFNSMGGESIWPNGINNTVLNMLPDTTGDSIVNPAQGGGIANSGPSDAHGLLTTAVLTDAVTGIFNMALFDVIVGGSNPVGYTDVEAGALYNAVIPVKGLQKIGVDTVTLLAGATNNNYAGNTQVLGGTLVVPDIAVIGASNVFVQDTGILKLDLADTTWGGTITMTGAAPKVDVKKDSTFLMNNITTGLVISNDTNAWITGGGTLDLNGKVAAASTVTGSTLNIEGGSTLVTHYDTSANMASGLFAVRPGSKLYFETVNGTNDARIGSMYPGSTLQIGQSNATLYRLFTDTAPGLIFNVDPADYDAIGDAAFSHPDTNPYKIVLDAGQTFSFGGEAAVDATTDDGPLGTAAFQDGFSVWHRPVAYIEKSGVDSTLTASRYSYNPASTETRIPNWIVKEGTLNATGGDGSLGATAGQWIAPASGLTKSPTIARQHLDGITVGGPGAPATLAWRGTHGFLPPSLYGGLPEESGTGFVEDKFVIFGGSTLRGSDGPLVLGYTDGVDNYLAFPTIKGTGPEDIPVLNLGGDITFRSGIKMDTGVTTSSRAIVNVTGGVSRFSRDLATGIGRTGIDPTAPTMDMMRDLNVLGGEAVIYNNHTTTTTIVSAGARLTFAPTTVPPINYAGSVENNGTLRASSGTTNIKTGLELTDIAATIALPSSLSYTDGALRQEFYTGLNRSIDTGGAGRILGPMAGGGFDNLSRPNTYGVNYWLKYAGRIDYPAGNATSVGGGNTPPFFSPWIESDGSLTKDDLGYDIPADPYDDIGFRATGQIHIETAGTYTFQTRSDDGSMLWMDPGYGWQAVVANDGEHGWQTRTGTAYLTPGYYDMAFGFYESGGDAGFDLMWQTPTSGTMALIPDSQFRYAATAASESIVQVDAGATLNAKGIINMYKTYSSGTLSITNDVNTAVLGVGPGGTATMASLTGNGTAGASINVAALGSLTVTGAATNINKAVIAGTAGMASLAGAGTTPTTTVLGTGILNINKPASTGGTGLSGMSSLTVLGTLNSQAAVSATNTVVGSTKVGSATAGVLLAGGASLGDNLAVKNGTANYGTNDLTLSSTLTIGSAAVAPTYSYVPGLLEGKVSNIGQPSGDANLVTPNPSTQNNPEAVQLSVRMGQTSVKGTAPGQWGDYETWVYTGQFQASATEQKTVKWLTQIDDFGYLKIDNVVYINDPHSYENKAPVSITLSPLWHDIEIRVGNGTGGAGQTSGAPGVGFDLNNGINYVAAADPGYGTIFQVSVLTDLGEAATTGALTAGVVTADVVNMMVSGSTATVGSLVGAGTNKTATVGSGTTLTVNGTPGIISDFNTLTVEGVVAAGVNPITMSNTGVININGSAAGLTAGDVTTDVLHLHNAANATAVSVASLTGSGTNRTVTVDAGQTLTVNGQMTQHSLIAVNAVNSVITTDTPTTSRLTLTGLLTGLGTVNLPITIDGGTISPGASTGTMNTVGQIWQGGIYLWEISDVAGEAGTDWDLLNIDGDLDLGAIVSTFTIDIHGLTSPTGPEGEPVNFESDAPYSWRIATVAAGHSIEGFNANKFIFTETGDYEFDKGVTPMEFVMVQDGRNLNLVLQSATPPTDDRIWIATGETGSWPAAGNWDPGIIPNSDSLVLFKDNGATKTALLNADAIAGSITFETGGYTIGIAEGTLPAPKLTVASGIINSTGGAGTINDNTIIPEVVFGDLVTNAVITVDGNTAHNLHLVADLSMGAKTLTKAGIGKLTTANVTAAGVTVNGGSMESDNVTVGALDINNGSSLTALDVTAGTFNLTTGSATVANLTGVSGDSSTATIGLGTAFSMIGSSNITNWKDININADVGTPTTAIGNIGATGTVTMGTGTLLVNAAAVSAGTMNVNAGALKAASLTAGTLFNVNSEATVTGQVSAANTEVGLSGTLTADSHMGGSLTVHGRANYTTSVTLAGTATVGDGTNSANLTADSFNAGQLYINNQASVGAGAVTVGATTVYVGGQLAAASHSGTDLTVHGTANYTTSANLSGKIEVGNGLVPATLTASTIGSATVAGELSIKDKGFVQTAFNGTADETSKVTKLTFDMVPGLPPDDQHPLGHKEPQPLGQLDLRMGKFIIEYSPTTLPGEVEEQVRILAQSGYEGRGVNGNLYWDGNGIISSDAATDPTYLHAFALIDNRGGYLDESDPENPVWVEYQLFPTWGGESVTASSILGMYTYIGDANMDGEVNTGDYGQIDNGFNSGLTGWWNGDFNYDGVVDTNDYGLIDNAYNTLHPDGGVGGGVTELGAVPEPATLGLMALGLAAMAARRRRSK